MSDECFSEIAGDSKIISEGGAAPQAYRKTVADLTTAIISAKAKTWQELLFEVSREPSERPYRLLGKLHPRAMPFNETLDWNVVWMEFRFPCFHREAKEEETIGMEVNYESIPPPSVSHEVLAVVF